MSAADWSTFNSKQPAGSYLTAVTADAPLSGSGTSGSHLVIAQANTSTSGYLSSTDWNTFNGKGSGTVTNVTGTSPISVSNGTTTPAISLGTVPIANGGTNQTAFTTKSGNVCGLVFFDGTSFQNDTTVTHVGYDTVSNTFYSNNAYVAGTLSLAGSTGISGQVLTSNGASAPTWQTPSSLTAAKSYAINMVLI